ncbi:hypothetical protein TNCV_2614201, partial [Trichonephila clavipes]
EGKGSVEDDERFGSPQTSRTAENTEKVSVRRYVRTGFKQRRGMKMKTTVLPHPPYSPDFSPCNFRIFPELARLYHYRLFLSADENKNVSQAESKEFQKRFDDIYKR